MFLRIKQLDINQTRKFNVFHLVWLLQLCSLALVNLLRIMYNAACCYPIENDLLIRGKGHPHH